MSKYKGGKIADFSKSGRFSIKKSELPLTNFFLKF